MFFQEAEKSVLVSMETSYLCHVGNVMISFEL